MFIVYSELFSEDTVENIIQANYLNIYIFLAIINEGRDLSKFIPVELMLN